ncbi:cytochrome c biogenesis protein DipZ [Bradyrhizobium canariense]|uniref:Cytochrome c biogenesis protein CcdA n=1 Tax=Bradyrhizobium canariense TaxID=255045 RepID=A0A1H1XVX4_9BRAD|nr:cytochrome c biogenesis protein DipZ [Bradyrhizobium canariense]SDT13181.1 Cytochrome c biogenesis protein CcdA [Bradyrhizobium canariense]
MIIFLLAYLGGVLTIVSPCILPVIPFVLARADRPFLRNGLPMLVGMALAFAVVASLASVAGGWVVSANQYGRVAALALLAVFGLTLLFPELADRLMRPLVAIGARMSQSADQAEDASLLTPLLLGVATGFLWAPCAGPVLGLILTGAALQGASVKTTLLLLTYAAGAATSLALALVVGGRVFAVMKKSIGAGEWIRRGLGAAVLLAIVAIALGLDTGFLTNVSIGGTTSLEQGLLDKLRPNKAEMTGGPSTKPAKSSEASAAELPVEDLMPSLAGAEEWLNSKPLTMEELKGKVVLIDFWTYSCINCLRAIPYVRAWAEKYRDHGLVVIGVHAPEFAFERNVDNVKNAIATLKIDYPVAIDNDYKIWRAFDNEYWPAHYFIDANGKVRHHHFGEGEYAESERVIQTLLAEAGDQHVPTGIVAVNASGAEAPSAKADVESPETYIGYDRIDHFISPGGVVQDVSHTYAAGEPQLNEWSLVGEWTIGGERALLNAKDGSIVYRFHARDLHLVLGPSVEGSPIRFRITIDGKAPGAAHGMDVDPDGQGIVTTQRLYQLVREQGPIVDHTFEIRFLDPGVQAYAFTFG